MEVSLILLIADFTSVCYNLIDKSGFVEVIKWNITSKKKMLLMKVVSLYGHLDIYIRI